MSSILIVFLTNVLFIEGLDSAKILAVYPVPSISHQVVFRPLSLELIKRGHEVTVITTDPIFPKGKTPANLTEIDVHDISYKIWRDHVMPTITGNNDNLFTQINVMIDTVRTVFVEQAKTKEIQKLINSKEHFDLLLVEVGVRPALAFSHIFNISAIVISSLGTTFDLNNGAPNHPTLYPTFTRQKIYNLSLRETLTELFNYYAIERMIDMKELNEEDQELKDLFGEEFPSYKELIENIEMVFLNVHPIWEHNRPVPPSVIYMGSIHQNPRKDLPKDLETYLNSSKNGVIYISFGTNVMPSMLSPEKIQRLINVFSKLPYDVLWKWDKEELPGRSENIKISKWLPQSDLLRHPKIKLFITQGGLQSTDEAITAGVPLIGIPMLGDQWYNVEHYVRHKIGVRLDMETLNEDSFRNAIETVIEDQSYRNNVIKLREIMYDQPQRPLERAMWWIEHVIRHGGAKHFRSSGANISWAEYLELKLVGFLLVISIIIISLCFLVIFYLYKLVSRNFVAIIKRKKS